MNASLETPARWQAVVFGLIALVTCIGAFVGLASSSLWIDELFTVYVIHHDGGLGEVLHRALTDVHPPFYYFLMYDWTRMAGFSEVALRLPSAIFAVAAIGIFAVGIRRIASASAISFGCAVAASSSFWFMQSQNTRSYALCMALAAALLTTVLALRRRCRASTSFPWLHWFALSLLGLLASLTHAYLLLAFGMTLLFLLLTQRGWPLRLALIGTGLVVLAVNATYYKIMLHSSQQDLQYLWFSSATGFFVQQLHQALSDFIAGEIALVIALLMLFGMRQRIMHEPLFVFDEHDTRWATAFAAFVLAGVIISGIGVSLLVAPSFSDRNLLACVPFAWLLVTRLYDAFGPRGRTRGSAVMALLIMLLVGSPLVLLRARELPRTESWRASADYVERLPGCADRQLPVILPYRFGHSDTYFRTLAERNFFGYYLPANAQTKAYLPSEFAGRHPVPALSELLAARAAAADNGGCTLLAWGVHDLDESSALKIALDLARQPGVAPHRVLMQEFISYQRPRLKWELKWQQNPEGYLFLAIPQALPGSIQAPALGVALPSRDAGVLGERVVVNYLHTYDAADGPPYQIDVYTIQRWNGQNVHEDVLAVHRLTCDVPPSKSNWDVWPDPAMAACSRRPPPTAAGKIDGRL